MSDLHFYDTVRKTDGVVLLYDITDYKTFDYIINEGYLRAVQTRLPLEEKVPAYPAGGPRFGCVLVGTKLDLVSPPDFTSHDAASKSPEELEKVAKEAKEMRGRRQVSREEAQEWAESQGMQFFEVHKNDRKAIEEALTRLAVSIERAERLNREDLMRYQKETKGKRGKMRRRWQFDETTNHGGLTREVGRLLFPR